MSIATGYRGQLHLPVGLSPSQSFNESEALNYKRYLSKSSRLRLNHESAVERWTDGRACFRSGFSGPGGTIRRWGLYELLLADGRPNADPHRLRRRRNTRNSWTKEVPKSFIYTIKSIIIFYGTPPRIDKIDMSHRYTFDAVNVSPQFSSSHQRLR